MKKMLVISPEFPFPKKCGITVRIGDMCQNIAGSVELYIYVCGYSAPSRIIEHEDIFKTVVFAGKSIEEGFPKCLISRIKRKILKPYFDDKLYISDQTLDDLTLLHKKHQFDAVMIHTPTLARCLNAFPDGVYKIIDSIDIWYQRYLDFCVIGKGDLLYHFSNLEKEMQLYRSVDRTLAISLWDMDFMISNGINPLYVPVSFKAEPLPVKCPVGMDILYAAGSGLTNIDAIQFFVDQVFPIIKETVSAARMLILNPCKEIKDVYSKRGDIVMLPFVEDIRDAYKLADMVVVPLRVGSGLKIKVLESFSYGKPTVVSTAAMQGIPIHNYAQRSISEDPKVLAREVIKALTDQDYKDKLSLSGLDIIRNEYNPEKVYGEFNRMLSSEI